MKHLPIVTAILLVLFLSPAVYASDDDCETDLGDNMRDLNKSLRIIKKGQSDLFLIEIDKAITLTEEAKDLRPLSFDEFEKDGDLPEASKEYVEYLDTLINHLEALKTADEDQAKDIFKDFKQLEKKSHRKFKDC